MSHEIRTPMNAIFGMITLAQKTADIRKMQYYLDKVNVSSHQLLSIINDVLDMSKIEANKLEISPIPFTLTKTIENAINITQLKSSEKKQNLNYKINDPFNKKLVSDELRISQVLINLLSNAVKFTPVNGSIFVNVSLAEESGTVFLILEVADTGVGIPEDSLDKIFNAFEQSDGSVTRKYGGTGLGLAICKKIAELMNGEISVISKVEEGSVFKFRIPVELGSAVMIEEQQKGMSLRSMGAMSVLVVDDVSDTLLYMQRIIGEICAKCDTAVSVTEAVVKIKKSVRNKSPYDIIIIDWYLENETAADVLQRTRNLLNEETIIVLSSIADFADIKQQVQELGHVHFLKKPVFPEDIYEKIRHAASSVKTEDSESHPNWNGKCILLAEDIEINREIVASLLEETEVAFEFAENGAEAVDKFKEMPEKFDLILMDMQMPVMDGITATKTIRKMSGKGKEIPIVAMTANAFKEDAQLCLEAGMNGHIPKPLEIETIYEVISKFMKTND
jgi:CheY-like chemotaxis protein